MSQEITASGLSQMKDKLFSPSYYTSYPFKKTGSKRKALELACIHKTTGIFAEKWSTDLKSEFEMREEGISINLQIPRICDAISDIQVSCFAIEPLGVENTEIYVPIRPSSAEVVVGTAVIRVDDIEYLPRLFTQNNPFPLIATAYCNTTIKFIFTFHKLEQLAKSTNIHISTKFNQIHYPQRVEIAQKYHNINIPNRKILRLENGFAYIISSDNEDKYPIVDISEDYVNDLMEKYNWDVVLPKYYNFENIATSNINTVCKYLRPNFKWCHDGIFIEYEFPRFSDAISNIKISGYSDCYNLPNVIISDASKPKCDPTRVDLLVGSEVVIFGTPENFATIFTFSNPLLLMALQFHCVRVRCFYPLEALQHVNVGDILVLIKFTAINYTPEIRNIFRYKTHKIDLENNKHLLISHGLGKVMSATQ